MFSKNKTPYLTSLIFLKVKQRRIKAIPIGIAISKSKTACA
jgi:hypothetical protein